MWQDLREPVEPIKFKFKEGVTTIIGENCLRLEIKEVGTTYIELRLGQDRNDTIIIVKELALRLSEMFLAIHKELEERDMKLGEE